MLRDVVCFVSVRPAEGSTLLILGVAAQPQAITSPLHIHSVVFDYKCLKKLIKGSF